MPSLSSNIAELLDWPLGWLLRLPLGGAILAVALMTSLVLTLARKWLTHQELLERCRADLARLKTLIRSAKQRRDRAGKQRLNETVSLIKLMQLRAEGRVLIWSLLPLLALATWAFERLEFVPPAIQQPVPFTASFPLSSIGKLTHILAPEGCDVSSAIQIVELDKSDPTTGVARWTINAVRPIDGDVLIRHDGETASHRLRIDGRIYAAPAQAHATLKITSSQLGLAQSKFLNVVPGLPAIGFAPWLVAYLGLTLLLTPLLRRVLRVA